MENKSLSIHLRSLLHLFLPHQAQLPELAHLPPQVTPNIARRLLHRRRAAIHIRAAYPPERRLVSALGLPSEQYLCLASVSGCSGEGERAVPRPHSKPRRKQSTSRSHISCQRAMSRHRSDHNIKTCLSFMQILGRSLIETR